MSARTCRAAEVLVLGVPWVSGRRSDDLLAKLGTVKGGDFEIVKSGSIVISPAN